MKIFWIAVAICAWCCSRAAQINPEGPTTDWKSVSYGNVPDVFNDQQTGSEEGDIVGTAVQPALYTGFYKAGTPSTPDGTFACRFRIGGDNSSGSWFSLGAASALTSPNTVAVPEPNSWVLGLTAIALLALWKCGGGN